MSASLLIALVKGGSLHRFRSALAGALTAFLLLAMPSSVSAQRIWNGGSLVDSNTSTAANWVGGVAPVAQDSLTFAGSVRTTVNHNLTANTNYLGIQFDAAASAFSISGNSFRLGSGTNSTGTIGFSANPLSPITQTINNNFGQQTGTIVAVTTQANGSIILNGVISDGGNNAVLQKSGLGTLSLNGLSTFGGQVRIDEGIVNANTIANAATSSSLGRGNASAANAIIRIGSTTTSGTLIFTGTSSVGTTDRQVRIGNGTAVGDTGGATIANNKASATDTLTFSNAAFNSTSATSAVRTLTLGGTNTGLNTISGVIANNSASGTIGVTKEGAGNWVLGGLNTFSGPLTINGGTLEFSNIGSSQSVVFASTQVSINNGSTLRISGSNNLKIFESKAYAFDSSGGGSLLLGTGNYDAGVANLPFSITTNGGAQNTIGLISTSSANGFNLGGSVATLNVALGSNTNSDLVVTPIISNGGSILKTGAGRLTLSGANTYTGTTSVNAGTLIVNGNQSSATGAVSVGDTATLNGTGTVGGATTVQAGGTIRGDSGTGTGNLTINANSTLFGAPSNNGATLATQLLTDGSGNITANSKLAFGANTFNLDSTAGKFRIRLLNDSALNLNLPYSIELATSGTADRFLRNGTPWNAGTNPFTTSDFDLIGESLTYTNVTLTVDASNSLILTFTPVPEPGTILVIAAIGCGILGRSFSRNRPSGVGSRR